MPALTAHHFGVTVADLERAVDFYTETFDLPVIAEFEVSGEAFADAVDVPGATGRFAHLDAGDARVELVEYEPAASGDGRAASGDGRAATDDSPAPALNRAGATHLGLEVGDLAAFHAGLDDDVETLSKPRTTASGSKILFVRDPEGNLVEVIEPAG